jgi:hypothetical protein
VKLFAAIHLRKEDLRMALNTLCVFRSIVCLNSKFPPPVELCWQNKNISKLGILITKVGNIIIL